MRYSLSYRKHRRRGHLVFKLNQTRQVFLKTSFFKIWSLEGCGISVDQIEAESLNLRGCANAAPWKKTVRKNSKVRDIAPSLRFASGRDLAAADKYYCTDACENDTPIACRCHWWPCPFEPFFYLGCHFPVVWNLWFGVCSGG